MRVCTEKTFPCPAPSLFHRIIEFPSVVLDFTFADLGNIHHVLQLTYRHKGNVYVTNLEHSNILGTISQLHLAWGNPHLCCFLFSQSWDAWKWSHVCNNCWRHWGCQRIGRKTDVNVQLKTTWVTGMKICVSSPTAWLHFENQLRSFGRTLGWILYSSVLLILIRFGSVRVFVLQLNTADKDLRNKLVNCSKKPFLTFCENQSCPFTLN